MPPTTIASVGVGPIYARGRYDDGRVRLDEGQATLPGGDVSLRGTLGAGKADVRYRLDARDLGRLVASSLDVARSFGADVPPTPEIAGSLAADGTLDGALSALHVAARLEATRLEVEGARVERLSADVDVAGLPDRPRGHVRGGAARILAGGTELTAARVDVELSGRGADGEVSAKGPLGPLAVRTRLELGPRYARLGFDELSISWPGERWTLAKPVRLELGDAIAAKGLSLRSDGGGTLQGSLRLAGPRFDVALEGRDVDLARLPPEVVPAELGLAGKLDVDAALSGTFASPRGSAKVLVYGGKARGFDGLGVRGEVELAGDRGTGAFTVVRGETQVDVRFDGPLALEGKGPVAVKAEALELDLEELARLLELDEPLRGKVRAVAELRGTTARPEGQLTLEGRGLAARGIEGLELDATLDVAGGSAHLDGTASLADAKVAADLRAAVDVGAMLRSGEVDRERLLATRLSGTVRLEQVELERLAAAPQAKGLGLPRELAGRLSLDAAVEGTVRAPRGTVRASVEGLRRRRAAPLDVTLSVAAADASTRAELGATLEGKPLLTAAGSLGAAIEALAAEHGLEAAPLAVDASVAEADALALAGLAGTTSPVAARVSATAQLRGTLAAPTAKLSVRGTGVALGAGRRGDAAADATYGAGKLEATARLSAVSGGSARVTARADVDLGLPALRSGAAGRLAEAPLDLDLEARRLELGFLQALSRDLRQVEGRLDGDLAVRGKLPSPDLRGWVMLSGGRLSYTNFGDVRDIFVEASFAEEKAELKSLRATSTGTLEAKGTGVRKAGGAWDLDGRIKTRGFAVVSSDLTRAYLDSTARFRGVLEGLKLDSVLGLEKTVVRLPNTPAKSVQDLADHPDFLVVRRGERPEDARKRAARPASAGPREPSMLDALDLKLALRSDDPVRLEGVDVEIPMRFDGFKLTLAGSRLALVGRIVADEGRLQVMSRRFEVAHANVIYTGNESPGDPRLDVEAVHESTYAKVTVTVGGSVSRPTTALRSNPPMPEAQIATLLATGRPELKRGGGGVGEASGAASALGALATTQLKKGLAAKLPVDVISFQAGEEEVFAGSTLEAGTYVTDRIYVGYSRTFNLEENDRRNTNEVKVEYQLAPQWTLESSYGDADAGGLDVFWTRDF